jgi:FAD/FMN-containing dehydrogenase
MSSIASGRPVLPSEPEYDALRATFNLLDDQRPAAIAAPRSVAEVVAAVRHAADHGLAIAAQGTGHGASAMGSLEGALLVKTTGLGGVSIDAAARTARVGAGTRWHDLVGPASDHGLAALHGFSPRIAIAGYTLSGGLGWYGRAHGLASSRLTAADVVLADGSVVRADADVEPELLWALKGGGGSFGVVTAIEFELLPVAELYAGVLFFPWERAAEVLHAWHTWTATAPEAATSVGRILQFPPLDVIPEPVRGKAFALVEVAFLGSEADGAELVAPLRALGPVMDTLARVAPTALGAMHMDPEDPLPYRSTHLLTGELPSEAIDAFVAVAGADSGSMLTSVELRHTGGALARSADGALPSLPGSFLLFGVGVPAPPADLPTIAGQLAGVRAALQEHAAGTLLSFVEQPTDVVAGYPPGAWARLARVRAQYDPDHRMLANHPVG